MKYWIEVTDTRDDSLVCIGAFQDDEPVSFVKAQIGPLEIKIRQEISGVIVLKVSQEKCEGG